MPVDRLDRGRRSEVLAGQFLEKQDYCILKTNQSYRVGEIDIIATEGNTLCFVEVRSTGSLQWGGPFATVTDRKRQRLIRAARFYLAQEKSVFEEIRFDVVSVVWNDQEEPEMELIRHAFVDDSQGSSW